MTVGILGSGFGLYGYLPAMVGLGERVVMPARYRAKLRGRPELSELDDRVEWAADDEAVLVRCATLVVSRRPADQVRDVERALAHGTVRRFLLEKPLAPDPAAARDLFDALEARDAKVRIGFIFAHTPWAKDLGEWLSKADESGTLDIVWRFLAHHHAGHHETWKRHHGQGGGALRFYGIHLIALLAEFGYAEVASSAVGGARDEAETWDARFAGAGRPACRVRLDTRADTTEFRVSGTGRHGPLTTALADPFGEAVSRNGVDRRVEPLSALCRVLLADEPPPPWYRISLALWAAAERQAVRQSGDAGRGGRQFASLD